MAFADPNAPIIARMFGTDTAPNPRIEIDSYRSTGVTSGGQIRFYLGGANEASYNAAMIEAKKGPANADYNSVLTFNGPNPLNLSQAQILLYQKNDGTSQVTLQGSAVTTTNKIALDTTWTNLALVNAWTFNAAFPPGVLLDSAGNVHLRSVISGGTAGLITTLAQRYWPTMTQNFAVKSNNDAGSISWITVSTSGAVTVVGNFAFAQTWCALDQITYSTF